MSDPLDLDARRAARAAEAEATQAEVPPIILNGKVFELPDRIPFAVLGMMGRLEVEEGITALLGDQAETFWAQEPDAEDIADLLYGLAEAYGIEPGELSASGSSSNGSSRRSRPTSSASTRSTSAKRSTARKR